MYQQVAIYLHARDIRTFLIVRKDVFAREREIMSAPLERREKLVGENNSWLLFRCLCSQGRAELCFLGACKGAHIEFMRAIWPYTSSTILPKAMRKACKYAHTSAIALLIKINASYSKAFALSERVESETRLVLIVHGFREACKYGHIVLLDFLWDLVHADERPVMMREFQYHIPGSVHATTVGIYGDAVPNNTYNLGIEGYLKALLFARENVIAHLDACKNKYGVIARNYCYARALGVILGRKCSPFLANALKYADLHYVPQNEWSEIMVAALQCNTQIAQKVRDLMQRDFDPYAPLSRPLRAIMDRAVSVRFSDICSSDSARGLRTFLNTCTSLSMSISRESMQLARTHTSSSAFACALAEAIAKL